VSSKHLIYSEFEKNTSLELSSSLGETARMEWYIIASRNYFKGNKTCIYEGWNFNSGNYLFTTGTK